MANTYWLRFNSSVAPYTTSGLAPTFISFAKFDGTTLATPGITAPFASLGIYQFSYTPSFSIAFVIDGATTGLSDPNRYIVGNLDINDSLGTDLLALGATQTQQGTVLANTGSTLVAVGNSLSVLSLQSTVVALGSSVSVLALGTTLTAVGNSLSVLALGTTLTAVGNSLSVLSLQTTLVALGTSVSVLSLGSSVAAMGSTISGIAATLSTLATAGASLGDLYAAIGTTASTFGTSATDPLTIYGLLKRVQENLEGTSTFTKSTGSWAISSRGGSLLATKTLANSATQVTKS